MILSTIGLLGGTSFKTTLQVLHTIADFVQLRLYSRNGVIISFFYKNLFCGLNNSSVLLENL
jgi:aspartate/glutamate racemase